MKKLLGIVVMGIGLLTYFVWPLKFQMLDYCALEKLGMHDRYHVLDFEIKSELGKDDIIVSSANECIKEQKDNPNLFKTNYFKKTFYGNFEQLINGNFAKLKIWAY
tara:strand:+ start:109 stop:426 length:318 start_codon:yes stop_codon:yes gene_type:complete